MKKSKAVVPPSHKIHQGFSAFAIPIKKLLDLKQLRAAFKKKNYDPDKFPELARAREAAVSFCSKHAGKEWVTVTVVAVQTDSRRKVHACQFHYDERGTETFILAAKYFVDKEEKSPTSTKARSRSTIAASV